MLLTTALRAAALVPDRLLVCPAPPLSELEAVPEPFCDVSPEGSCGAGVACAYAGKIDKARTEPSKLNRIAEARGNR